MRLVVAAAHPNRRGPRRWAETLSADTVARMRRALESHHDTGNDRANDEGSVSPPSMTPPMVHPAIDAVVARASAMRPGEIWRHVRDGHVRIIAAASKRGLGIMTADGSLVLTLRQADAQRAHQQLGGHYEEVDAGVADWEIDGQALTTSGVNERVLVLILRALALAADDGGRHSGARITPADVTTAILEARRYADGPDDMRLYWSQRLNALLEIFGCTETAENRATHGVIDAAARGLARDSHPLAGVLECPLEVTQVAQPHADIFREIEKSRQAAGNALIVDLLRLINPQIDAVLATEDDVAAYGVARNPPRDFIALLMDGDFL